MAALICLGAMFSFALERARAQVEQGLSHLLQTPVHVQGLTLSLSKMTLHGVLFQASHESPALLAMDRIQIAGPLLSMVGLPASLRSAQAGRRPLWSGWQQGGGSITVTGVTLSFAGVPLHAQGRLFLHAVPGSVAECDGWFTFQHPFLRGQVEISGKILEPVLLGWLEGFDGQRRHFVGQMAFTEDGLRLSQMEIQGGWSARATIQRKETLRSFLQWEGPDGKFELRVEPLPSAGGRAVLWIHEQDQIPEELIATWVVRRSHLEITSRLEEAPLTRDSPKLAAGAAKNSEEGRIYLNGRIDLKPPYPIHLTLEFKEAEMADLVHRLLRGRSGPIISGPVVGRVSLSGPWGERLVSRGELVSHAGKIGREEFLMAAVRFSGEGPILKIQNSHLTKSSGVMLLEGTVDLRRLGRLDFFRRIRVSPIGRSLAFSGWQMSPTQGASGLQMSRTSGKDHPTVSMVYEVDQEAKPEPVIREKVDVKVPLSSGGRVNMTFDREGEFVGVEHHKKF